MSPRDAPSVIAARRSAVFQESTSDNIAMVVLVGEGETRRRARRYYDTLVDKLERDSTHVQHVHSLWGP